MVQKWNLGDIVPPERERKVRAPKAQSSMSDVRRQPARKPDPEPVREEEVFEQPEEQFGMMPEPINGRKSSMRNKLIIGGVVAVAVLIGIVGTMMLGGADVTVYPKHRDITLNETINAKREAQAGELPYELLSLEEESERKVSATGQEKVSERATGTITIYNNFSSTVQRLIKNTRFESPDGLIYRINESVEVPGFTKAADGSTIPGSKAVAVFADGVGDKYNIKAGKFTVPGLKGSEQFDKIYAESKESMAGGFEGLKYIVNETELSVARNALQAELREKLLARLKNERPNGFIFYEPSVTFSYTPAPATDAGNQMVTIKEKGKLLAPLFKQDTFASYVASKSIPGFEGVPVRIEDPSSFTFAYSGTTTDPNTNVEFTLKGPGKIIWVFDSEKLRNELRGLSKTALPQVLSAFPSIKSIKAVVKPFWKTSLPDNIEDITIIEVLDGGE